VISLVIGGVHTNMTTQIPIPEVAPGALFRMSEKRLAELKALEAGEGVPSKALMPADVFAKKVVNDVLGGARGRVWRGGMASIVWLMLRFLPQSAMVSLIGLS
jgi:1-acylglycerone phosphate reductase